MPPLYQQNTSSYMLSSSIERYRRAPYLYTEEQAELLREQASNLGVDIDQLPPSTDFNLINTVSQALSGFGSGLTTIHFGEDPRNTAEAIARNIGHLLGFVGFIPGVGILGKALGGTAALAAKTAGGAKVVSKVASTLGKAKSGVKVPESVRAALRVKPSKWGVKIPSVPMLAADWATKGVGKILGNVEAFKAVKYLAEGSAGRAIARGAFHLGAASAVSNWQQGTDAMMEGFVGGAQMGAVFGGIGNYVKLGKLLKDKDPATVVKAEKVVRGMAGAAFTGLPSTARGDATEMQVYEYMLGAWFGAHAIPASKELAMKIMHDPEHPKHMSIEDWQDPSKMRNWGDLPEGTREEILRESTNRADQVETLIQELEAKGLIPKGDEVEVSGGKHAGKIVEIIKRTPKGYQVLIDIEKPAKRAPTEKELKNYHEKLDKLDTKEEELADEVFGEETGNYIVSIKTAGKEIVIGDESFTSLGLREVNPEYAAKLTESQRKKAQEIADEFNAIEKDVMERFSGEGGLRKIFIHRKYIPEVVGFSPDATLVNTGREELDGKRVQRIRETNQLVVVRDEELRTLTVPHAWLDYAEKPEAKLVKVKEGEEHKLKVGRRTVENVLHPEGKPELFEEGFVWVKEKDQPKVTSIEQEMRDLTKKQGMDPQEIMDSISASESGMATGGGEKSSVAELSNEALIGKLSRMEKSEEPLLEATKEGDKTAINAYWSNQKIKQNIINAIGFDPRPTLPEVKVTPKETPPIRQPKTLTVKEGLKKLFVSKKKEIESEEVNMKYGSLGVEVKLSDVEKAYWDGTKLITRADKKFDLVTLSEEAARTHLGEFEELAAHERYDEMRQEWYHREDESVKIDFDTANNKMTFSLLHKAFNKAEAFDMIYGAVEASQKKMNLSSDTPIIVKTNFKYKKPLTKISDVLGKPFPKEAPKVTPEVDFPKPVEFKSGVTFYDKVFSGLSKQYKKIKDIILKTGKPTLGKIHTAWYGDVPYEYSAGAGRTEKHKMQVMPEEFKEIARLIELNLGVESGYFNSALVNVLPKGRGIGAHADNEQVFQRVNGTIGKVATVSFGGDTKITITDNKGRRKSESITVKDGDLYVMPGKRFQLENKHAVGKSTKDRISLTFRHIPKNRLPKEAEAPEARPEKQLDMFTPQETKPDDRPAETSVQTPNREVMDAVEDHEGSTFQFHPVLQDVIKKIQTVHPGATKDDVRSWVDKRTRSINKREDFTAFIEDLEKAWDIKLQKKNKEWLDIRTYFNRRISSVRETQSYFTLFGTADRGDMNIKAHIILRDRPQSYLERLLIAAGVKKAKRKVIEYIEWMDPVDKILTKGNKVRGTKDTIKYKYNFNIQKLFDAGFDGYDFQVQQTKEFATGFKKTTTKRPLANIFLSEHGSGYTYLGGVKDKNRMIFIPHQVRPEDATSSARALVSKLPGNAEALYHKGLERFIELMQRGEGKNLTEAEVETIYAQSVYSTATVIKKMNGNMPLETMIHYNELSQKKNGYDQFILDPVKLNQRMQIVDAGEVEWDPLMYEHIADMKNGVTIAIVNAVPKELLNNMVAGKDILKDESGKPYDAHLDGVFILRNDVFEANAVDGGIPSDGAVLKGFLRYTDAHTPNNPGRGAILGKYAIFRAGKEASEVFSTLPESIHGLMFDTSVKQLGRRNKHDIKLNEDGNLEFYEEGTTKKLETPETYTIPHSGFTISSGNYEHVSRAVNNVQIVKQLLGNLNNSQVPPHVIREVVEKIMEPAIAGDHKANTKWDLYLRTGKEEYIKDILEAEGKILEERFEKIGLDRIMELIDGEKVTNSPLYRKFAEMLTYINENSNDYRLMELDDVALTETISDRDILTRTDEMLRLSDKSTGIMNFKLIYNATDRLISKYATRRIIRPLIKHSGSAIGIPYDPWLQRAINLKSGTFYLNNEWKNFPTNYTIIKDDGLKHTLTLEQLVSRKVELKNRLRKPTIKKEAKASIKKDIEKIDEALWFAIIRVPSDSISGTRILKFAGFTNRKGAGILLHPKDMGYLGGMDLDIDKVHIYQNMPKSFKDEVRKHSKEWEDSEGNYIEAVSAKLKKIFSLKPWTPSEKIRKGGLDPTMAESPYGMLDPMTRFYISHNSYKGNKMLGLATNMKRRIQTLVDITKEKKTRIYFEVPEANIGGRRKWLLKQQEKHGELHIELVPKGDNGRELQLYARAIMNMAADAAKYPGLIDSNQLMLTLFQSAFKSVNIVTPKGAKIANLLANNGKLLGYMRGTFYKGLENLTQAIRGWDYDKGRSLTLSERSSLAKEYLYWIKKTNEGLDIPLDTSQLDDYYSDIMSRTRHNPDPAKWLDEVALTKQAAILEKIANSNQKDDVHFREVVLNKLLIPPGSITDVNKLKGMLDYNKKRDYYSKTLAALVSINRLYDANKAFIAGGGTREELTQIFANADSLLTLYANRMIDLNKLARRRSYESRVPVINEVNEKIIDYVETLSPQGKKAFFEYFIGTMSSDTYSDNLRTFGFESPAVPSSIKRDWLEDYSNLVQKAGEPATKETVEVFTGKEKAKNPKLQTVMEEVEKEAVGDIVQESADKTGEAAWKGLDDMEMVAIKTRDKRKVKETEDIKRLRRELRWIFQKYPDLAKNISKSFPGITSLRGFGIPIPGAGVTIGGATAKDIEIFVNYWRGLHGRNFLKDLAKGDLGYALKWFHFYFFPDTISKKHQAYDINWFLRKGVPVRDASGKVYKHDVLLPFSHLGKLSDLGIKSNGWYSNTTDEWDKKVDTLFDFIYVIGEDAPKLIKIATDLRQRPLALSEKEGGHDAKIYEKYALESEKELAELEGKTYTFPKTREEGGGRTTKTARETVDIINKRITEINKEMDTDWFHGDITYEDFTKDYRDKEGNIRFSKLIPYEISDILYQGRQKDLKKIGLENLLRLGHEYSVSRSEVKYKGNMVKIKDLPDDIRAARMERIIGSAEKEGLYEFKGLGILPAEVYWPHNSHIADIKKEYIKKRIEEAKRRGKSDTELARLRLELETTALEALLDDGGALQPMGHFIMQEHMTEKDIEVMGLHKRVGHSLSRGRKDNVIPSWDKSLEAYRIYMHQIIKANFNMMFTLGSHRIMEDLSESAKTNFTPNQIKQWTRFGRLHMRDILGIKSSMPENWIKDKKFPVKNTLYYRLSDQNVKRRMDKIANKWFGGTGWVRTNADGTLNEDDLSYKLNLFSNLEAKWELMTLLTHTKTMVNNFWGGSLNTMISVGFRHWKNAGSLNYLTSNVPLKKGDPANRDWDYFTEMSQRHGAIESFLRSELKANPSLRTQKGSEFIEDLVKSYKKDGSEISRATVFEIGRKHGFTKSWIEKSAWFMKFMEQKLRRRAFFAHYLNAMEVLSANKVAFDRDDPWLIELAMKGVEGTQYLYNNAARPAFTRTALGRVYSRFQLWAWNSLKFRKDIYQGAKTYGFQPGTPEFDRFKRMSLADLFMFSMATAFPLTMFESTLPPPWNYVQDMSDLLFGSEHERDRAFFGTLPRPIAPLQAVSPPIARHILGPLGALLKGDWSKFTDYQIWTWAPFGRIARDIKGTLEYPSMLVEKSTGIPIHRISKALIKRRERPALAPGGLLPLSPNPRSLLIPQNTIQ